MTLRTSQTMQTSTWIDLYTAALMEGDDVRVAARISEAENAIAERVKELFNATGDNIEEEERLDDALYCLQALRNCLTTHGRFADAA